MENCNTTVTPSSTQEPAAAGQVLPASPRNLPRHRPHSALARNNHPVTTRPAGYYQSSTAVRRQQHNRRTSEPVSLEENIMARQHHGRIREGAASTEAESFSNSASADETSEPKEDGEDEGQRAVATATSSRRQYLDRNWNSASNLFGLQHQLARGHRSASISTDPSTMLDFHQSWATSNSSDFLLTPAETGSGSAILPPTALVAPGPLLATASMASLTRVASVVPNTDEAGISSVIHDAARITDWDKVLALCKSNPEAASYVGRDGWTALHHACNRRCPYAHVVETIIQAYPDALLKEEEKGWLPLHYATRFKAPKDVVLLLLYMFPQKGKIAVSRRERLGRTPLYYAIRYDAPPGVVGLLLEVDPSAVLSEDQMEDSPLALVWDSWAEKLEGKRIVNSFLPGGFPEPEDTTVEHRAVLMRARLYKEPKLLKRWVKINMLLKAAFGFPVEDDDDDEKLQSKTDHSTHDSNGDGARKWRIVHATAAVKCHLSLFLLACALHPEQARELDESDLRRPGDPAAPEGTTRQTALHLAASSNARGESGKTVVITLLSLHREAAQVADGIDGSLPLHRMVENPCKQDWPNQTAILYHFYPRAVQIADRRGRLPLHRAAAAIAQRDLNANDSNQTTARREREEDHLARSVIVQLVRSFPQAASRADLSGCLPFHMIAMNAVVWDDDVDAVLNCHRSAVFSRAGHDCDDRLALHMAAANPDARESLIHRLIQFNPRGAQMADRQGKLPLHLACEAAKAWEAGGVKMIYEAYPTAISIPEANRRGWLPLHMAAANSQPISAQLMQKLVELYPAAAEVLDHAGRYPFHLACASGGIMSWEGGLQVLLDAHPNAIAASDKDGLLPLHMAALRYCRKSHNNNDDDNITLLRTPEEIKAAKENAEKQASAELDILYHLLRDDPTTLSYNGTTGKELFPVPEEE